MPKDEKYQNQQEQQEQPQDAEQQKSEQDESGEAPYTKGVENHTDTNAGPDAKEGTVADMPDDPEEAK